MFSTRMAVSPSWQGADLPLSLHHQQTICLMAHQEVDPNKSIGNDAMVAGAFLDLRGSVCLFKCMTKSPKVSLFNAAVGRCFITTKERSLSGHLDLDSEMFQRVLYQRWVDECQKLSNIVSSVTMSTEVKSNEGCSMQRERDSGSTGLSG
jgi:hypothetical protein